MAVLDQTQKLSEVKVIGFDLDNTLYPSTPEMQERIRSKIYERLASELSISKELAKDLFEENYNGDFSWSQSGSRTIEELARTHKKSLNGSSIVQQAVEQADILDFIQPNPKLQDILTNLFDRDFYLDLITGSGYDLALQKLKKIGISDALFCHFLAERKYGSKTTREVYRYWLAQYFLTSKDISENEMLYIGDNKKQDIDAPKRLGIKTCIVGKQYENADFYLPTINDLEGLLFSP